jgi:hypothetical protein
MNKLIFGIITFLTITTIACTEKNGTGDESDPNPRSSIPSDVKGKWVYGGSFSATDFWKYNGSYGGKGYEQGMLFDFKSNGKYEVYTINSTTYYGCRTESYAFTTGNVTFDEAEGSFTIQPKSGTMRGFYSCASSSNFKRDANTSELKSKKYYYVKRENSRGESVINISTTPDVNDGIDFSPTAY